MWSGELVWKSVGLWDSERQVALGVSYHTQRDTFLWRDGKCCQLLLPDQDVSRLKKRPRLRLPQLLV